MSFRLGPLPGSPPWKPLSFIAWLLFVALLPAAPLSAHGGGKQQLAGEAAGPYRLYVWTSPEPWRVGEAHTTVAVTRLLPSGEETPATGLQVLATYVQGDRSQRIAALEQTGAQAGYYEADNAVAAAGDWQVTIAVTGPEGEGTASFSEIVLPANEFNWWLIGGSVLLALLLLGFFGTRKAGHGPVQRGASL